MAAVSPSCQRELRFYEVFTQQWPRPFCVPPFAVSGIVQSPSDRMSQTGGRYLDKNNIFSTERTKK